MLVGEWVGGGWFEGREGGKWWVGGWKIGGLVE